MTENVFIIIEKLKKLTIASIAMTRVNDQNKGILLDFNRIDASSDIEVGSFIEKKLNEVKKFLPSSVLIVLPTKKAPRSLYVRIYDFTYLIKRDFPFVKLNIKSNDKNKFKTGLLLHELPVNLNLEPGNGCSLKCPGCLEPKVPGVMDFEDYRRIIDQFPAINHIEFYNSGEPLLNKELSRFIDYAKGKGASKTDICTSLNIDNDDLIEKLCSSMLDKLIVSLDGADAETYKKYKKRGDFELVMRNLNKIKSLKPNFDLVLQFIPLSVNEHQIDKMIGFAKDIGADYFKMRICNSGFDYLYPKGERFRWDMKSLVEQWRSKSDHEKTADVPYFFCQKAFTSIEIRWDGTVYPFCCPLKLDQAERKSSLAAELGIEDLLPRKKQDGKFLYPNNCNKNTIKEIWLGEDYYKVRRSFLSGEIIELCRLCKFIDNNRPKIIDVKL
ncbi:MAG: radical SAM protein [Candidatus Omnitrophota bacterium]